MRPIEHTTDRFVLGIAIAASLVGLTMLIRAAEAAHGSVVAIASVTIYGTTLVTAYLGSALYESRPRDSRTKTAFQALDHSTIFLLIAGTYTPFCVLALANSGGWWLLSVIWAIATVGISIRVILMRFPWRWAPALYLLQGWIGVFWSGALVRAAGSEILILIAAGGAAYTLGVGFYLWRTFRWGTVIWHLFVVTGSICHFIAIARLIGR